VALKVFRNNCEKGCEQGVKGFDLKKSFEKLFKRI
jgi:hypothetical protein